MGLYAQTTANIICKDNKTAKKVLSIIKGMRDTTNTDLNFDNFDIEDEDIEVNDNYVVFFHSSQRDVNLEWQLEQVWDKIKDIDGVNELSAPFLVEGDGCYFTNEE